MKRHFLISCFVITNILVGCAPSLVKPVRPEFQQVHPPKEWPKPLKPGVISEPPGRRVSPIPPSGVGVLVRVMRNSSIIRGTDTSSGFLTMTTDSIVKLLVAGKTHPDTITVGLALPPGMHVKTVDPATQARIRVTNRSSPGRTNEDIAITTGANDSLYLRYVWNVSADTLSIGPLGSGLRIVQEPLPSHLIPTGEGTRTVRLFLKLGGLTIHPILLRQVTEQFGYKIFVQSSLYQSVAEAGGDARKGYILRAIVVKQ